VGCGRDRSDSHCLHHAQNHDAPVTPTTTFQTKSLRLLLPGDGEKDRGSGGLKLEQPLKCEGEEEDPHSEVVLFNDPEARYSDEVHDEDDYAEEYGYYSQEMVELRRHFDLHLTQMGRWCLRLWRHLRRQATK